MTGFGAGEATREGVLAKVELRAVNHRFFDPSIRIPRDWTGLEGRVKERIRGTVSRGRVTVSVEIEAERQAEQLVLDEALAEEYRTVLRILEEKHGFTSAGNALDFAQLPDVVRRESRRLPEEVVAAVVDEALVAALEQLGAMREREGAALRTDLESRLARLGAVLDEIEKEAADASADVRERLRQRVAALVPEGVEPDAERLATEIALLAEKADITEELVRFRAHNEAFAGFLAGGEAVGKRLDFLLQEMNREANTIGSKSSSAGIAHRVVELKEEIERLREQVQNIE
jgi:uncharacterized protein (TIGR00255 family)